VSSKKKLVKKALKNPEVHTPAELQYMEVWLNEKKRQKELKKNSITVSV
jgi:hypothetical protein